MNEILFKKCLGSFVTGVTVITTNNQNNDYYGITINSFSSVSLNPPLILFSLGRHAIGIDNFQINNKFIVNILSENQEDLSIYYAFDDHNNFSKFPYILGQNKLPIFKDVLAYLECSIVNMIENGDHITIIGKIEYMNNDDTKKPLIYYKGKYMSMKNIEE